MAKEGNLVAALLIRSQPMTPSVSSTVTVVVIIRRSFYKIINVDSLEHLREVQRHPVKDDPRLCIGIDVFVASAGNDRCTRY
jgi:hypothetical protein